MLRTAEDNLTSSKTQIAALKKKLEEVEKARATAEKAQEEVKKAKDEAEQHGYDVGMAETEDILRAEVLALCRTYCAQTWEEALNQAGVEASFVLRRAESVYYLPAIHPASSSDSKADPASSEAVDAQGSPTRAPSAVNTSSEGGEQAEDTIKAGDANQGAVQGAGLAPTVPGDLPKEKETSQNMELVLATLTIPSKADPKDKAQVPPTAANTQPPKDVKEKLVIKMKK